MASTSPFVKSINFVNVSFKISGLRITFLLILSNVTRHILSPCIVFSYLIMGSYQCRLVANSSNHLSY